jgi:ubiquitin C
MQIFVETLTGRTMMMGVEASDSIDGVRQRIQNREGIPAVLQRLSLGGKPLNIGSSSLAEYNIQNNSTLVLHAGLYGGTRYWEDELHANADGGTPIAAASNTNPKKEGVIKKKKSVTVEKRDNNLEHISRVTCISVPGKTKKRYVRQIVDLYGSSSVGGAPIRDAVTGNYLDIRVGSAKSDHLFKVSDTSGFERKKPLILYYSGPREYEAHVGTVLDNAVVESWYDRHPHSQPTSPRSDEDGYVVVK